MSEQHDNGTRRRIASGTGTLTALAAAALLAAGCGQKGPLYLPEDGQPAEQTAGTAAPGTPAAASGEEADEAAAEND